MSCPSQCQAVEIHMNLSVSRKERILKLVVRLIKESSSDPSLQARALKLQRQLTIPMSEILEKVPGKTIGDKIKLLGITRQAWYQWMNGTSRPSQKRAEHLHKLTGYSVSEIRALDLD